MGTRDPGTGIELPRNLAQPQWPWPSASELVARARYSNVGTRISKPVKGPKLGLCGPKYRHRCLQLDFEGPGLAFVVSLVHNHIKSSSIIVKAPSLNAKVCHFVTAELCIEAATPEPEEEEESGSDLVGGQKLKRTSSNSHTSDSHVGHRTTKTAHEASSYIKWRLGGRPEDAILFCGSGSTGSIKRLQEVMGIAVPSTLRERMNKCTPSEERWVVLVGPYEHHSNLLSWRQSLAEVIEIGLDEYGLIDMEDLRQKLESYRDANRPILGSFSACCNVTGIYTDTRAVAKLLHQFGAFACFDFAASAPYVKIDMRSGEIDGYDAIFLSVHKFLGGPGSPGILLMSKALYHLGSSPPSTCGGGTVDYVNGFNEKDTLYVEDIEERENAGTPQVIQIIRAALAFWLKDYVGYEVIEKLEDKYINEAIKRLSRNQNIEILGNKTVKRQAILSFLIYSTTYSPPDGGKKGRRKALYMWGETGNKRDKPLHGPVVAILLNDLFGIQARGGCACASPYGHALLGISGAQSHSFRSAIQKGFAGVKPGWTRVSFPYYLFKEEFGYIIAALEFVASYGHRFLPLCHFNLKTANWTFKKKALIKIVGKERKGNICILEDNQAGKNLKGDDKQESLIRKYTSYWESAKHTAGLLPKFPSLRRFQVEIDPQLLYFRI
ncbi:uncharacterized protein LOC115688812 [Syzygium oleosum]|uniref:uncharacterized protein LOC115688812 n=1 Tax=Syzygium oleosum TaxID=219896 RepID=UPI0024BB7CEF|nr:uncharacterized protein LOC115688812 [Syzygium oleosum]